MSERVVDHSDIRRGARGMWEAYRVRAKVTHNEDLLPWADELEGFREDWIDTFREGLQAIGFAVPPRKLRYWEMALILDDPRLPEVAK